MADRSLPELVWWGPGPASSLARAALAPLEWLYGGVVWARGRMYDAGVLASHDLAIPAISVGNLSVGGTGKTPVAAWLAAELRRRGASPAILLRGYGSDEARVHEMLNPEVVVVASADRLAAAREARARGCDIAVLDDAFQHRRARRIADVVLLSADRPLTPRRLLPAGPWREPLDALRRASLVVVTRKGVDMATAASVAAVAERVAPRVPRAIVYLAAEALRAVGGEAVEPLDALRGASVLAISAIGDPAAFRAQLERAGARVERAEFADHHHFRADEIRDLVARAARVQRVVCTLKDAVKLASRWPRVGPPIWYVSQRLLVERGGDAIDSMLAAALAARHPTSHSIAGV